MLDLLIVSPNSIGIRIAFSTVFRGPFPVRFHLPALTHTGISFSYISIFPLIPKGGSASSGVSFQFGKICFHIGKSTEHCAENSIRTDCCLALFVINICNNNSIELAERSGNAEQPKRVGGRVAARVCQGTNRRTVVVPTCWMVDRMA